MESAEEWIAAHCAPVGPERHPGTGLGDDAEDSARTARCDSRRAGSLTADSGTSFRQLANPPGSGSDCSPGTPELQRDDELRIARLREAYIEPWGPGLVEARLLPAEHDVPFRVVLLRALAAFPD